jgi:hypothetical protein
MKSKSNQNETQAPQNEAVTKLTAEELEFIQKGTLSYKNIKSQIGDLEIQKAKLINEANAIVNAFLVNEKALIEKYGENAVINMDTGEVTQKQG